MKQNIMVIVHPASACGSADDLLGRDTAAYLRLEMQCLVQDWEGPLLVLDGHFSDELDGWRGAWQEWGQTIKSALDSARDRGQISTRVMAADASDYTQEEAIVDLVKQFKLTPRNTKFTLTGAWVDGEEDGCVHSVRQVLEKAGFSVTVEDAMDSEFSFEEENEDEDDEEIIVPPSPRARTRKP